MPLDVWKLLEYVPSGFTSLRCSVMWASLSICAAEVRAKRAVMAICGGGQTERVIQEVFVILLLEGTHQFEHLDSLWFDFVG